MIGQLTNHLWQSTFFAVAAGLLTLAFRKNRAKVRYWLWLSASLKFFIPFWLLMSLGSHLEWAPAAQKIATQIAAPSVSFAMEQISEPFPAGLPAASSTQEHVAWVPIAIFCIWLCGFVAIALIRSRGWLRIRAAVRASAPLEIAAAVEARLSPGLLEPGVVGVLRPILLLPEGIVERLTPSQLEAVLAHELCHVRRRDNLFASIHMIVESMFWFHPLVWWIGARLVEERERACDEEVLSMGNQPRVYADAILNVCKLYVESPLVCVSGVTGANIRRRIEAIMTNRGSQRLNRAKKFLLASAGVVALAGPVAIGLVIGIGHPPAVRAQSPVMYTVQAAPADPANPAPQASTAPAARVQVAQARAVVPQTRVAAPKQPAVATPKFDVASIRPCDPNAVPPGGRGGGRPTGRFRVDCVSVRTLIERAYVRFADGKNRSPMLTSLTKIEGGPAWIGSDLYTIEAETEGTQTPMMMDGPMMQALLEERFHLKIHRETREVPIYALTEAKGGSKIQPAKQGPCVAADFVDSAFASDFLRQDDRQCRFFWHSRKGTNIIVATRSTSIEDVVAFFTRTMDRLVINRTGITGLVDFRLVYAPDESTPVTSTFTAPDDASTSADPAGPSIFTALQQQLGLKLEPAKGPREYLVIDSVSRPSEN